MAGDALPDANRKRRIDGGAGHDGLAFRECRQFRQEIVTRALNGGGHAALVVLIDDAQQELRHALRKHVGIQLAGALADEAHAHPELAALRQNGLEDVRRYYVFIRRREVMGLFEQDENWVIKAVFGVADAFRGVHARLPHHAQEHGHDHLLLAAVDFVELQDGTESGAEELVQIDRLDVVEIRRLGKEALQPPVERARAAAHLNVRLGARALRFASPRVSSGVVEPGEVAVV